MAESWLSLIKTWTTLSACQLAWRERVRTQSIVVMILDQPSSLRLGFSLAALRTAAELLITWSTLLLLLHPAAYLQQKSIEAGVANLVTAG